MTEINTRPHQMPDCCIGRGERIGNLNGRRHAGYGYCFVGGGPVHEQKLRTKP
jgi:hypothetical protein